MGGVPAPYDGSAAPRTSVLTKAGARPGTAAGSGARGATAARPMTSSKGAGYTSGSARAGSSGGARPATSGGSPTPPAPRDQCDALEERVHQLLEEAASRAASGDTSGGVDAAREAARREQRLSAMLEQAGQGDQISLDLKFGVSLGLAAAYEANQQYNDALAVYNQVLRSRLFPQVGPGLSSRGSGQPAWASAWWAALAVPPHLPPPALQLACRLAGCASTSAPSTSSSRTTRRR
jgi:intraflagellar transport protein 88